MNRNDAGKDAEKDRQEPWAGADDRLEELSIDGWSDSVIDWLRAHWRSGAVMVLVACLACGAGIAGTYVWMSGQHRRQPRIEATLYQTKDTYWRSQGRRISIGIRVRNSGSQTVTVDRARLSRPGFTIVSGEPDRPHTLASNGVAELAYTLAPDCDVPEVRGPTTLHLLLRTAGQEDHWFVVTIPQAASNANANTFAASHFQSCFQIGAVQLTTLRASRSAGRLTLRVRLTAQPVFGTRPPHPVRLFKLTADQDPSPIRVSFAASGPGHGRPADLPVTGTIRIEDSEMATKAKIGGPNEHDGADIRRAGSSLRCRDSTRKSVRCRRTGRHLRPRRRSVLGSNLGRPRYCQTGTILCSW